MKNVARTKPLASDEERDVHAEALHLLGHVHHLCKGGRDEARQAHHVRALRHARLQDRLGRNLRL